MDNKKKSHWLVYLITTLISLVVGTIMFLIIFFSNGKTQIAATDAASVTGFVLICIGLLIFVSREGFFDIFSYGFKQFGSMLFGKRANLHNNYPDYINSKKEDRKNRSKYYLFVCLIGLIFVTAFIILKIIFFTI